nr:hypothetical protein [uncultured Enterocloster sp.]
MKVVYEESDIGMALMALNQMKVEGVQQAGLLITISNTLNKGVKMEEPQKEHPEAKGEK